MRNFGTIFIKTIQEFRQGVNRREKHPHFLKIGWGSTAVRLPHSWITGMIFLRRAECLQLIRKNSGPLWHGCARRRGWFRRKWQSGCMCWIRFIAELKNCLLIFLPPSLNLFAAPAVPTFRPAWCKESFRLFGICMGLDSVYYKDVPPGFRGR